MNERNERQKNRKRMKMDWKNKCDEKRAAREFTMKQ